MDRGGDWQEGERYHPLCGQKGVTGREERYHPLCGQRWVTWRYSKLLLFLTANLLLSTIPFLHALDQLPEMAKSFKQHSADPIQPNHPTGLHKDLSKICSIQLSPALTERNASNSKRQNSVSHGSTAISSWLRKKLWDTIYRFRRQKNKSNENPQRKCQYCVCI